MQSEELFAWRFQAMVCSCCSCFKFVETMLLTACRLSKALQLTLAVIKPDAVAHPLMLEVP